MRPPGVDEEVLVENLFDCCCCCSGGGWLALNGDEVGVVARKGEGDPGVSGRRKGELRWEGTASEGVVLTRWSGRAWSLLILLLVASLSSLCHCGWSLFAWIDSITAWEAGRARTILRTETCEGLRGKVDFGMDCPRGSLEMVDAVRF